MTRCSLSLLPSEKVDSFGIADSDNVVPGKEEEDDEETVG